MILLANVKSTVIKAAMRLVTAISFGKTRVQESNEAGPYGWDSCPIPGCAAVYMDTTSKGDNVIIGYVGKNQIAQPGESRMYCTDTNGTLKYFVYVKADKILIGNGTPVNHFVQWEALNTQLQAYFTDLNKAIGLGCTSGGGTYAPPTSPLDLSTAKTTNILTN